MRECGFLPSANCKLWNETPVTVRLSESLKSKVSNQTVTGDRTCTTNMRTMWTMHNKWPPKSDKFKFTVMDKSGKAPTHLHPACFECVRQEILALLTLTFIFIFLQSWSQCQGGWDPPPATACPSRGAKASMRVTGVGLRH